MIKLARPNAIRKALPFSVKVFMVLSFKCQVSSVKIKSVLSLES
jgi:hypothetical protein